MVIMRRSILILFICLIQHIVLAFDRRLMNKRCDTSEDTALLEALDLEQCVDGIELGRVVSSEFEDWIAEGTFPRPEEIDNMHLEWVDKFI